VSKYIWDEDLQSMRFQSDSYRYRSKWACFKCRTAFTRCRARFNADQVVCPVCASIATDMGYLFEPPAKRNIRLWKVMEVLGSYGIKYDRAGNVVFINYALTGNNRLQALEVEHNVLSLLKKDLRSDKF
jgi:heterodisulfide reductase subunit C